MNNTMYYYYPPKNPQFFFPYCINSFPILFDIYFPYSIKSKIIWYFFKNFHIFRNFFLINENKIPFNLNIIKNLIEDNNYFYIINLGTYGIEQKTTITVYKFNGEGVFFIKYGNTEIGKKLVENEKDILEKKDINCITPKLINFIKNDHSILITNFINGKKISDIILNKKLIEIIIKINNLKIYNVSFKKKIIYSFSHGDFCPWNILIKEKKYILIDWEMAGGYPLGYDIFNYIFQTNFLLNNYSIKYIINSQHYFIEYYFKFYNIKSWRIYLNEFTKIKLSNKSIKNNKILFPKYIKLFNFIKNKI